MGFGRKNEVVPNILSYNFGLLGESGVGKTTTIFQMCQKLVGDDGYLFIECGNEDGASAINGINYINCPDWNSDYDEFNNSVGFYNLVEDILENKKEEYPNLKVVVIDTYDQLISITEPEVVRRHNRENPEKKVKTIRAAFGGYMAGQDMVDDIIIDYLWKLKRVGVSFIIIGHVKQREITDPITNETYSELSTDMSLRSFNKIKNKLHFLGVAHIDRNIVKKNRNGKKVGIVTGDSRRITFRDDSYSLDAKSRFADITPDIPLDADVLIKTLQDAINSEAFKSGKSMDEMKAEQKKKDKIAEKKAEEYSESIKENKIDIDRNKELVDTIQNAFMNMSKEERAEFTKKVKNAGIKSFKDVDVIPTSKLETIVGAL